MASRRLTQAAFRFADRNSERLAALPATRQILATVSTVTPDAAADGNALVTVTWRGGDYECAGYANSYTPVAGDRVLCALVDDQLIVAFRLVGYP
jgi:hypothetical protein